MERETGRKAYSILQLRLHPEIIKLKKEVEESPSNKTFDFDLTYQTSRGKWYYTSWKGDESKSGGIATNIGVHFFDMLAWIFGDVLKNDVHIHTHDRAAGYIEFKRARIRWFLSINYDTLSSEIKELGKRTYRSLNVNGKEIEFSEGFTDLHTKSYEQILKGEGFRISESKAAVEIVHQIRNSKPMGLVGNYHPMALLPLSLHPFKK
jgi:UDP-N-acetyl-2-amino-2-deoxyglucuronate dehydrogenase